MKKIYKVRIKPKIKKNFKRFISLFLVIYYLNSNTFIFKNPDILTNNKRSEIIEKKSNISEKTSASNKLVYTVEEKTSSIINKEVAEVASIRGGYNFTTNFKILLTVFRVLLGENSQGFTARPTPNHATNPVEFNNKLNQQQKKTTLKSTNNNNKPNGGQSRKFTKTKFNKNTGSKHVTSSKVNKKINTNSKSFLPMNKNMISSFKNFIDDRISEEKVIDLLFDHRRLEIKPSKKLDRQFFVHKNDLEEARIGIFAFINGLISDQDGELTRSLPPKHYESHFSTKFHDCDFEFMTRTGEKILVEVKSLRGEGYGRGNSNIVASAEKLYSTIKKQYAKYTNKLGFESRFIINIEHLNLKERSLVRKTLSKLPRYITIKYVDLSNFVKYSDLIKLL